MAEVLRAIKEAYVCLKSEAKIYDARGNGDGKVCCSIVGGHQSSISDYTAIVLEIYEDISDTRSGRSGRNNAE